MKDIAIMKQMEWHKGQLRALKGVFNEIATRHTANYVFKFVSMPINMLG